MNTRFLIPILLLALLVSPHLSAQSEEGLKLSGEFKTDQRVVLKVKNDWAWNENRLSLKLDKRISGSTRFYSELWVRNMGLPTVNSMSGLYNKGIIDPFSFEVREAYVRMQDFPIKNMDFSFGRQHISWGTADQLNPTSNLNPYDLEDLLDFGRRRGTEALNLQYYFNHDFSLQAVYVPFFRPANLPVGIFADVLMPEMELPMGMQLGQLTDTIVMPAPNFRENATAGLRFKGFAGGIDFSVSYAWTYDGLPMASYNKIGAAGFTGLVPLRTSLKYARTHIFGADFATTIGGFGLWGEAAVVLPHEDFIMRNDVSDLIGFPLVIDSLILDKTEPYVRFIVGSDYNFSDGSYMNLQYMHGFIHEHGQGNLNDYFFMRYEKSFFREKLKISPLSGAFIVTDWKELKSNYAIIYMPEVGYMATPNTEIKLAALIAEGKGDNMFVKLKDFNMLMLKLIYSF